MKRMSLTFPNESPEYRDNGELRTIAPNVEYQNAN